MLCCCVYLVVGLPCVAKFSFDNKWYRARVTELGPSGLVTVMYVDYGNTETLPLSDIRKLLQRFLETPPRVMCSVCLLYTSDAADE